MRLADLGVRSMELFSMERRGVLRGLEMGVALLTGFLLFQTHITKLISFLKAILKVICLEEEIGE